LANLNFLKMTHIQVHSHPLGRGSNLLGSFKVFMEAFMWLMLMCVSVVVCSRCRSRRCSPGRTWWEQPKQDRARHWYDSPHTLVPNHRHMLPCNALPQ
jgi:hypothetical protein